MTQDVRTQTITFELTAKNSFTETQFTYNSLNLLAPLRVLPWPGTLLLLAILAKPSARNGSPPLLSGENGTHSSPINRVAPLNLL